MYLFPAIDLYEGKAVRLFKGQYDEMTVYSDNPVEIAEDFLHAGASHIHIVDLEGAKSGGTPNLNTILSIKEKSEAFCEIGGGIRSMDVIDRYLSSGIDRVILGTAAVNDEPLLTEALMKYGEKIAVGADLNGSFVAVKGWLEKTTVDVYSFFDKMESLGVRNIICTDISKDGAMQGTNRELYRELSDKFSIDITASGGVSSIEDILYLKSLNLYGAIIGKAYYTGAVNLKKAIEETQ
jgi:phosphoribosylformimino-5-aminoimidazole carboxamide ribotide isomerase